MEAAPSATDLQEAVDQINADVKAFERRAERLARWKVGVVAVGTVASIVDHAWGSFASVAAVWLYERLKHNDMLKARIPEKVRNELADAKAMLVGLSTGSSLDAVVVSRSRKAIGKT